MSDVEERESLSREIDPAIWAVAPRLHQEEGPIDVTASPAFQCLDEVSTSRNLDHSTFYRVLCTFNRTWGVAFCVFLFPVNFFLLCLYGVRLTSVPISL